ncbi:MAG: carbohydrate binding family 9 domain-containing protein [Candidatus Zixiibacteriota bacterium]|nr:MAG: carbohydrate binding family 9 domain-containing protein [candidate division Zixibacteria bacterium]
MIDFSRCRLSAGTIVIVLVCLVTGAIGQEFERKEMEAVRINGTPIELDGVLDEAAWKQAKFVSDFLQKEPDENGQPQVRTEVAILYDDNSLYIGGRMYTLEGETLRAHLDRRDRQGPVEQLIVSLDTYLDRRTAYGFGITASGVRFDRTQKDDRENPKDFSFDPVWEAQTSVNGDSWTAEMRIPFSQLRFINQEEQVWGININRWIPTRFEDIFWVVIPRGEQAWSSHFGNLVGISGIEPARRLEVLPYAASDGSFTDWYDKDDPFTDGSDLAGRMGADLKMGLGPNLTLEATFNPDFGQVEADPAVVNLSQYETYFPERRPFFTEGNELFRPSGPDYFYSRRIGAAPHGWADGDFTDQPDNTTILGASKITGRLSSGTSIGILSAVTAREHAKGFFSYFEVDSSGPIPDTTWADSTHKFEVEPPAFYNVARVQQELRNGATTVGAILTSTIRDVDNKSSLSSVVNKQAYSGGVDWRHRFASNTYEFAGWAGFSHVRGSAERIANVQSNSTHYYQRPDAGHVSFDPTRTSLSGYTASAHFSKISGRHWVGGIDFDAESPGFELNDVGELSSADDIVLGSWVEYREQTPGPLFRNYNFWTSVNTSWNFDGVQGQRHHNFGAHCTWLNNWGASLSGARHIGGLSDSRTRGGPLMAQESGWSASAWLNSNHALATNFGLGASMYKDDLDGWDYSLNGNFSTRIGTRLQLSLYPRFSRSDGSRQWVDAIGDSTITETYGRRYVFARIRQSSISMQIRANYFFTPDLSLEVYAQPFVASGQYYDHGELVRPETNELRTYGEAPGTTIQEINDTTGHYYEVTDGTDTLNVRYRDYSRVSFRSNVVLRWEWSAGSILYLVWQRNLAGSYDNRGYRARPGDLFDAFGEDGSDFVALKISYWIPVT